MNSRFRAQLQRFLHFVERRGHPRLLQALVDETQQLALLFREHLGLQITALFAVEVQSGESRFWLKQIANKPKSFTPRWARGILEICAPDKKLAPGRLRFLVAEVSGAMAKRFSRAL